MQTHTESNGRWVGVACLLAATAAWGGLFHTGKLALAHLDPFWFTVVRYAGASLMLAVLLASRHGISLQRIQGQVPRLFAYGMLGYAMFGILVFIGLRQSLPSHGAVIMATMPLTTLFMKWGLDGVRPPWWAWAAGLVALVGVSLVSGIWTSSHIDGSTMVGDGIAWIGTLGWILYTRGQQKVPQLQVIEYTAYTAMLAFPGLVVVGLIATWLGYAHVPSWANLAHAAPVMVYIVAIATVAAALAFNQGVRRLGASNGIVFINFVPVSALIISAFRGDMPSTAELTGTGLVCAGLLLMARQMSQPVSAVPPAARAAPSAASALHAGKA